MKREGAARPPRGLPLEIGRVASECQRFSSLELKLSDWKHYL